MNNILNFKSFMKFLSRNMGYTAIDVFGLSVSLMFVILITVYTYQELATDRFQENGDRICVIGNEKGLGTAIPIPYRLKEQFPEIEKVCPVVVPGNFSNILALYGDNMLQVDMMCTDSTFFDFFSFKLLKGNRELALEDPYSVVLSETFARKMFGGEEPIGKSFRISDSTTVIVSGVMEDIRRSVLPSCDILARLERAKEFNGGLSLTNEGNAGSTAGFLMLHKGADLASRTSDIYDFLKESFWPYTIDVWKEVRVIPFNDIYFSSYEWSVLQTGDRNFVLVLMSVGILILIFAVFNYINLTVAQAGQRAREMATRRLLGSSRTELFIRLMIESTMLTLFSFIIGLLLAVAAVPYVNELLDTKIYLADACTPAWIGMAAGLILLIGVLSGFLPAMLISASKPIDVVRGTFRRQTKMVFSKVFITFQNTITIATLSAALVMGLQIYHMIVAPLGYNTSNILVVANTLRSDSEKAAAIDRIRELPHVKAVGFSNGTPFSGTNNLTGVFEGKSLSFQQMTLDSAAFKILGLQIKHDNQVASSKPWSWYLTERAFRDMELPENAEYFGLKDDEPAQILGVLKDFHLRNINMESAPVMLRFRDFSKPDSHPWNVLIEVDGEPMTTYSAVREIFEDVTKVDFEGNYLEQKIEGSFDSQIRLVKIVLLFACVAILISMLGLLAMSTYFIQQRSQEVAVRKVFGSDNRAILSRLVGTFLMYVVIAFVIAAPISWYIMDKWIADYSYRITLSPLIFLVAGLFCLLISFFAVFYQSWQAANANPVESVKVS
ncbi:ABC transporter permease [Parabacteroides acidifaciens]|uniref:ABC transporter permease n=1 Tax=Parabacteroides acidifaciens TaxID=2290935 RepID=A0A3D8HDR1_9BACT|nr:ABC transporter permease [Parabacteroides acidifaciens]MBC8602607.1 ABC transporter permease [Parabacteroides acidifaciens]RDU48677.1 ABC transporter permease [Parabacteroides acidifaciens]